jgi:hypothetical protein
MSLRVLRPASLPLAALACALAAAPRAAAAQRASASPDGVRPTVVGSAAAPEAAPLAAAAAARRAAPFAGRWELNTDDSAFGTALAAPRTMAMGVRERRGTLRVDVTQDLAGYRPVRNAHSYALDGAARRDRRDGAARRVAFAGDTLVLTRDMERDGRRVTVTDRWFLAADGARLGMSRHVAADGDEAEQFFVFDRRED